MAFIEARLALTPSQQPLFAAWKDVVLQDAQARSNACSGESVPSSPPGLLERKGREAARLKMRLASLETEMPRLSALYQALSPDQKRAMDFSGYGHFERPRGWRHHDFDDGLYQESHWGP